MSPIASRSSQTNPSATVRTSRSGLQGGADCFLQRSGDRFFEHLLFGAERAVEHGVVDIGFGGDLADGRAGVSGGQEDGARRAEDLLAAFGLGPPRSALPGFFCWRGHSSECT